MYEINPDYLRFIRDKLQRAPGLLEKAQVTYVVGAEREIVSVGR
jgi:hypothetical protein